MRRIAEFWKTAAGGRTAYCYRPYCPWRHRYIRERAARAMILAARLLLVLECMWFCFVYVREHTSERIVDRIPEAAVSGNTDRTDGGAESESTDRAYGGAVSNGQPAQASPDVFGFGIERDGSGLFWFRIRPERESATAH